MYSLYIDTHFKEVVIVLYKEGKVIDKKTSIEQKQSVITMPLIEEILNENNIIIDNINEIITVTGPGSFTGVRIGVTISKMLAMLLKISIKEIDYLEIMNLFSSTNSVAIEDNNGAFVGIFKENKKIEEYKYLKKEEYDIFCNENEVTNDVEINYQTLYEYISKIDNSNYHKVNPVYVKQVV